MSCQGPSTRKFKIAPDKEKKDGSLQLPNISWLYPPSNHRDVYQAMGRKSSQPSGWSSPSYHHSGSEKKASSTTLARFWSNRQRGINPYACISRESIRFVPESAQEADAKPDRQSRRR